MVDKRGLSNLGLHEIEEIDAAGTIALTDYVIVSDGNIPKKIKISVLITLMADQISILDLSDTPSSFSASDTWKTNSGADAVEQVTV